MKKLALCTVLMLISVPLFAGILGLSAGATGGVEMWQIKLDEAEEAGDMQNYPAIGLTADFSPPIIPIGVRGSIEYAWKSEKTTIPVYGDITTSISLLFVLIGLEYSVAPPLSPASLYFGAGYEIATISTSMTGGPLDTDVSETDSGVLFYTGTNLNIGLIAVFAETGYGIIFMEGGNIIHIPIRGGIKVSI
jgi:hypothetical protein